MYYDQNFPKSPPQHGLVPKSPPLGQTLVPNSPGFPGRGWTGKEELAPRNDILTILLTNKILCLSFGKYCGMVEELNFQIKIKINSARV